MPYGITTISWGRIIKVAVTPISIYVLVADFRCPAQFPADSVYRMPARWVVEVCCNVIVLENMFQLLYDPRENED